MSGRLKSRKWLSTAEGAKNILIRLEIPKKKDQWIEHHYEPGDHLSVFPTNSDEEVRYVMEYMINKPKEDEEVQLYEYNQLDGK